MHIVANLNPMKHTDRQKVGFLALQRFLGLIFDEVM